jgi:tetratricopeptide (TPR) repeat protein
MTIKLQRLLSRAKKLSKKGHLDKAQAIYTNIIKDFPNNQEAKKGLLTLDQGVKAHPSQAQLDEVMNFYSSGQMQEALAAVNLLLNDYPNEPLLFNISGACYSEIGPIESAITSFEKAISLKLDYAEAHYNLGVAFQKLLQLDKALEFYEKAITFKHAYPAAHNNLGLIFLGRGQLDSSIKCFEWAIAYSPEYAEAHNNLGAAFQELKQYQKAMTQFEKAVTLSPGYAQAFHNLGILSEILGLPDEAFNYYERALAYNPEFAEAYRNLSKIKKFTKKDPLITQMQSLYSRIDLNLSDKVKLCFALAKVNEDLGNHDKFFQFLNEGNRLRKQELNYSLIESKKFHSSLIKVFKSAPPVIKRPSNKTSSTRPIFIIGMPRSGTTLVEQIISSHHAVHGAGELTNLREIISPILENHFNQNKSILLKKDLLSIRKQYLDSLSLLNVPELVITDKMPLNFRLIGFILSALPEVKIIHLKRDARATCWSMYKHYFTDGNGFTFNQEDLAEFYSLYMELMDFWHELFPNKIYDVCYEDLTTNQELETRKLLKYCELDWDENCLNFHKSKRAIQTASASQVRKKMYQGSSEAWKKYEAYLKPLINNLSSF